MKKFVFKSTVITDLLSFLIITVFLVIVVLFCNAPKTSYNNEITELNSGWTDNGGDIYNMNQLPAGDLVITHDLEGVDLYRKRLCFISIDTHFRVTFDVEGSYEYSPSQPAVL